MQQLQRWSENHQRRDSTKAAWSTRGSSDHRGWQRVCWEVGWQRGCEHSMLISRCTQGVPPEEKDRNRTRHRDTDTPYLQVLCWCPSPKQRWESVRDRGGKRGPEKRSFNKKTLETERRSCLQLKLLLTCPAIISGSVYWVSCYSWVKRNKKHPQKPYIK